MGKKNVASGDDVVAVQAGKVGKGRKTDQKPAKGSGKTTNVRKGNARVGVQYDDLTGDLHIGW